MLVVRFPLTVQIVPAGIVDAPSTVNTTFTEDAVFAYPTGGEMITTVGGLPRTTAVVTVPLPKAFVQVTVIEFGPIESGTVAVVAEPAANVTVEPFAEFVTVQVVPAPTVEA